MGEVQLSAQQMGELSQIRCAAFEMVDEQYGSGFPDFAHLGQTPLGNHTGHHSRAVSHNSGIVGPEVGLSSSETAIAETAGAAHDVIQMLGPGINEAESAVWLTERLQKLHGMPHPIAAISALAIHGTEPIIENGMLVGQKANVQDYPSKLAEVVAKTVASSDFGELYTPQGPYLAHELYREFQKTAFGQPPPLDGLLKFQRQQVELLNSYKYPLPIAGNILATHRSQVIAFAGRVLLQLERGEIHTFGQLLSQDKEFWRRHSQTSHLAGRLIKQTSGNVPKVCNVLCV